MAAAELPKPALPRDGGQAPVLAAADYVVSGPVAALETKPLVHRAAFIAPVDQSALKKPMVLGQQVNPRQTHRPEPKPASSETAAVKAAAEKAASPIGKAEKPTRFAEARKPAKSIDGMLDASLIKELSAVSRAERTEDVPAKR
jgi:hypothetical protein